MCWAVFSTFPIPTNMDSLISGKGQEYNLRFSYSLYYLHISKNILRAHVCNAWRELDSETWNQFSEFIWLFVSFSTVFHILVRLRCIWIEWTLTDAYSIEHRRNYHPFYYIQHILLDVNFRDATSNTKPTSYKRRMEPFVWIQQKNVPSQSINAKETDCKNPLAMRCGTLHFNNKIQKLMLIQAIFFLQW